MSLAESVLIVRNSEGRESRPTLVHVTRRAAVFEIYDPSSSVQLSEVLPELRIERGARILYKGSAIVSNLLDTGLMLVVSVTLIGEWSLLSGADAGVVLGRELAGFVQDWERTRGQLRPSYQNMVTNLRDFLGELRRWLGLSETVTGLHASDSQTERVLACVSEIDRGVGPKLRDLLADFEHESEQIDPDTDTIHKAFARRELHPLVMCAPFFHRSFTKPLGYAGDYETVNMIARDPMEGPNVYAKIVNATLLRTAVAQAHRNRLALLVEVLVRESDRVAASGRRLRVLNVACGPAIEVQRFVREHAGSQDCHFTLLDFNAETLEHARSRIVEAQHARGRTLGLETVHRSVHQLLKGAVGGRDSLLSAKGTYDLVYCAGLFDYVSDKVCQRLCALFAGLCRPGGLILTTNVHISNPQRYFMAHVMDWHLIYRDETGMARLAPPGLPVELRRDATGCNILLECRRS